MIFGVPIIACDICCFSVYVQKADAGTLLEGKFDQIDFNNHLLELVNNNDCRHLMSENGIKYMEKTNLRLPSLKIYLKYSTVSEKRLFDYVTQ